MVELFNIQQELKAPKNKYNDFGKFAFRNTSGILEALKPLLKKYKCTLTLNDELEAKGERYYIHAIVTLTNETGESIVSDAWAREQDSKSGMDAAQLTGACSSYARKYALCGLFAIDDSDYDPDAQTPAASNVLTEGCDKWEGAIKHCIDNNLEPAALRKWYELSAGDEIKLKNAIAARKLSNGDSTKEKEILEFQQAFGLEQTK